MTSRPGPSRRTLLRSAGAALCAAALASLGVPGCTPPPPQPYGVEEGKFLPGNHRQVWAVAPAVNLSGEASADPILQADLLFGELQQVQGLTVIPVNRVVEVYLALHLTHVESEKQAALICDLLGCDALVIPTVTAYDPYEPPKLGASLQLFLKPAGYVRSATVDPRLLARQASPTDSQSLPAKTSFVQAIGVYDAANGSVRQALERYAKGRYDPVGPYAAREYRVSMDRYCGFVYSSLIDQIIHSARLRPVG